MEERGAHNAVAAGSIPVGLLPEHNHCFPFAAKQPKA